MKNWIELTRVSENNLKDIDVRIPYYKHTVIAGVSGSGKSTLAYDVIYATAQRKLLDCMSDREQRFSKKMRQPKVGNVEGLSTVISLKQVKPDVNPRSTIGTYTGIGSHVRSLMAIHGQCQCLCCDKVYEQVNLFSLIKDLENFRSPSIVEVSFPYFFANRTSREMQLEQLRQKGYRYVYVNGERKSLRDFIEIDEKTEFLFVVETCFGTADKLKRSDINYLKSACENGARYLSVRLKDGDKKEIQSFYRKYGCAEHQVLTVTLEASDFSYNEMTCACPECLGSGMKKMVHPSKAVKYPQRTLRQAPFFKEVYSMSHPYNYMCLYSLACHYGFSFDEPYEQLSEEAKALIMYGSKGETFTLLRPEGYDKVLPNYLAKEGQQVEFPGVLTKIEDWYHDVMSRGVELTTEQEQFFKTYMYERECPDCKGTRLKKIKNYIRFNGKTYSELGKMEFSDLREEMERVSGNELSRTVLDSLKERLDLMKEIGLGYLSFGRRIDSLSGGEYQRLRIANQVGSGLVGLTYIIDEPTDGLHGSDNRKVIGVIQRLLEKGNTVITIEHDLDVIKAADYLIELGPGAGVNGGEVIAAGTLEEIQQNPNSIVGRMLSEKAEYSLMCEKQEQTSTLAIYGIEANNVKNVDIELPLGKITCFTGVSGSGKSSVVHEVLYKALYARLTDNRVIPGKHRAIVGAEKIKNIICIDQQLLTGKNTSIPATYLNLFDCIRELFARSVEEENEMKNNISYFSFNSKGACPVCKGKGYRENYIPYFGETKIVCGECKGQRYMEDVLQVKYRGKNIKQVLDMSFGEALVFFEKQPFLYEKIKLVCDLGLDYMQLGQQLSTVSGGEAQRLKLAREMSKYKNRGNLLYIFDEPTVGLHFDDITKIIEVMKRIVADKNTVVMVEHNPDMILNSDYVIDMGPNAGRHGGEVMFCGTPAELLNHTSSKTAEYLREYVGVNV